MLGPYCRLAVSALAVTVCLNAHAFAQDPAPRPLTPGVLTVIPPDPQPEETATGPTAIAGIVKGMPDLKWTPHFAPVSETVFERAQNVILRRPVWCLEFAFKPLRMIEVDVPQPSGKMQRKRIWYLVYKVNNVSFQGADPASAAASADPLEEVLRSAGTGLQPAGQPDRWGQTVFSVEPENFKTWFMPHIVVRSHEYDKEYLDRIIPAAQRAIAERERVGVPLHNSVEISQAPIPLSDERTDRGVWGVATWEDIDPRIDFFSIYVGGLTNAFQLPESSAAAATEERRTLVKTLQLNFWRPGDSVFEHEREFRYGVPYDADPDLQRELLAKYGLEQRLDHTWVYR